MLDCKVYDESMSWITYALKIYLRRKQTTERIVKSVNCRYEALWVEGGSTSSLILIVVYLHQKIVSRIQVMAYFCVSIGSHVGISLITGYCLQGCFSQFRLVSQLSLILFSIVLEYENFYGASEDKHLETIQKFNSLKSTSAVSHVKQYLTFSMLSQRSRSFSGAVQFLVMNFRPDMSTVLEKVFQKFCSKVTVT